RAAAAALALQHQQTLATQAAQLQQSIASRAANEVFAVARKTLSDLADADLEERMVAVFTRQLATLSAAAKDQLGAALQHGAEPAVVRSHFALPAAQQAAIRNAVNVRFSADVPLRFETAPDAICGIELRAGGQKLAWTIAEYLRDLERGVASLLTSAAAPDAHTAGDPIAEPRGGSAPRVDPVTA
ncbi:MAG: F0F1 ATP synthase subunit delta, partial [Burkholderiaceae bacterium]